MGWWSRSNPKAASPGPSETSASPPSASSPPPSAADESTSQPQTSDQRAEAELSQLLQGLEHPSGADGAGASRSSAAAGLPSTPTALENSIPVPSSMKCHHLFDAAYHCSSLGGQLNNVYRYGGMRDCSEQWSAFWFCMRTRTYGAASREEAVRKWYREQEGRVKKGPCSDDVWEERTTEERRIMAESRFQRDPDADFGMGRGQS